MSVAAVVTAAGAGVRMGGAGPKALLLLDGEPLVVHAVRALVADPRVRCVVVSAPADDVKPMRSALEASGACGSASLDVVAGGRTRQESVLHGVRALGAASDVVLVHDAARPLVPVSVVSAVIDAVASGADAVVPVVPVSDSVRAMSADVLGAVVDRSALRAVQTPQGFARAALVEAHEAFAADGASDASAATDDASLVERWGPRVVAVPGSQEAFKVTRPLDLLLAEAVLRQRRLGAAP